MLQINNFKKAYSGRTILEIEQLQLPKGMYWLQGENGSGKSTFLKCVAGIIPCQGTIAVHNIVLQKQEVAYKQNISYQAAEAMLPPFLTGINLMEYYQHIKKGDQKDTNKIIETLGIGHFIANKIGTYSSGMQKKLSLALAFIGHNKLILLDEPLTTIDVESSKNFLNLVQQYASKNTSFIITSHQKFEYESLHFDKHLFVNNSTINLL
jgi:ABC-2 type transport system ATP-binding protein